MAFTIETYNLKISKRPGFVRCCSFLNIKTALFHNLNFKTCLVNKGYFVKCGMITLSKSVNLVILN
jgi:hypothetical protein